MIHDHKWKQIQIRYGRNLRVVYIWDSEKITIKGLDIFGATKNSTIEPAGIRIMESNYCIVEDCRIGWDSEHKNYYGIEITSSSGCIIQNNIVKYNYRGLYDYMNYQVFFNSSQTNNIIKENDFSYSSNWGCYLHYSEYDIIYNNTFNNCTSGGVYTVLFMIVTHL
ncbi:MAG: right-handed parallel beta-helix repeat-containing protein [Melioribacteraceae bacterium]|nr:right-handed parallel beta-helix repeat-containing protein [Melioribacteraceae bacterium]